MTLLNLVTPQWGEGKAERCQLYAVRNVNTGDTLDVSNDFSHVQFAVWICTTNPKKDVLTSTGNIVTIGTANLTGDAGYVLVFGGAS